MAMLAEPRRRQKYSIDPRGVGWSNGFFQNSIQTAREQFSEHSDEDKFGQKMLEKMGWQKGKGLGANEDGRTEHVKVGFKSDTKGVGCTKSYADNWIAHQDDFNSLLSQLNSNHGNEEDSGQEGEAANRVQSLESKSKSSKSRVHYQKFTKGKDLSARQEVDLDCIFGKRKSKSENNTPLVQSEASSDAEETKSDPEGDPRVDHSHGITTVTSSSSIADYFAEKMAQMKKNRAAQNYANYARDEAADPVAQASDESEEGISFAAKSTDVNCSGESKEEEQEEQVQQQKKKKKKSKRKHEEDGEEEIVKTKKTRKSKRAAEEEDTRCAEESRASPEDEPKRKKKKSKRAEEQEEEEPNCVEDSPKDKEDAPKRKKKKSKRAEEQEEDETNCAEGEEKSRKEKKKKRSKDKDHCDETKTEETKTRKKSKSLKKSSSDEECVADQADAEDEDVTTKKKKKKRKQKGAKAAKAEKTVPSVLTQGVWDVISDNTTSKELQKIGFNTRKSKSEGKVQGFKGSNFSDIKGYAVQK